ncbi:MAG: N-acetylmuramoyl-L-alanine amidase, partial [Chloroflexota bacterium]|nr:N-acetylmuramoyl-L-alanine amidase [Chloroflexota bacterium]
MRIGRDVELELRAERRRPRPEDPLRRLRVVLLAGAFVAGSIGLSGLWSGMGLPALQGASPALEATGPVASGIETGTQEGQAAQGGTDSAAAVAAVGAKTQPGDPPGWVRIPKPALSGPRKVGIQAGHWRTDQAPPELRQLLTQTGTSWDGYTEWETNLDIAERVAVILRAKGLVADVLPTIVPPGYVADAFVSLHSDGDGTGEKSGFKLAHSTRRTPHEDALQRLLTEAYAAGTGLDYDAAGITGGMRGYYAHSWSRVRWSTSPFTPSVILEMGFLSNDHDRGLIVDEPDR